MINEIIFQKEEIMKELLPSDVVIPSSFEIIGHIAHLNLRAPQLPYKHLIGQAILDVVVLSNVNFYLLIKLTILEKSCY